MCQAAWDDKVLVLQCIGCALIACMEAGGLQLYTMQVLHAKYHSKTYRVSGNVTFALCLSLLLVPQDPCCLMTDGAAPVNRDAHSHKQLGARQHSPLH